MDVNKFTRNRFEIGLRRAYTSVLIREFMAAASEEDGRAINREIGANAARIVELEKEQNELMREELRRIFKV